MRGFSSYKTIQKLISIAPKVSAAAASSFLLSSSISHASSMSNEIALTNSLDLSKNKINKMNKMNQSQEEMFYVYDMHSKEFLGKKNSQKEAMFFIMENLYRSENRYRYYTVYQGEYSEENKTLWSGNSWSMQQYVRENGYHEEWKNISIYNAKRIFGENAVLNQHPEDPEIIDVKFPGDSSPDRHDIFDTEMGPYRPSMR